MLEIMYEIPSEKSIKEVVVTEELILNGSQPIIVYRTPEELAAFHAAAARETKERDFGTGGS